MDADQIISALGGPVKLSLVLGIGQSAVSNWKVEGIPPARAVQLGTLAQLMGRPEITAEIIVEARAERVAD